MRFLAVLNNLGTCPGFPEQEVASLEDELIAAGLMSDDWSSYMAIMMNGTQQERENWHCWMRWYMYQCAECLPCPDADPFTQ